MLNIGLKKTYYLGSNVWSTFPITPTDPARSPFPFPTMLVIGYVTDSQEEGRKLTLIEPQYVPHSGFNTFMDRRLFNPSNLPRG